MVVHPATKNVGPIPKSPKGRNTRSPKTQPSESSSKDLKKAWPAQTR